MDDNVYGEQVLATAHAPFKGEVRVQVLGSPPNQKLGWVGKFSEQMNVLARLMREHARLGY